MSPCGLSFPFLLFSAAGRASLAIALRRLSLDASSLCKSVLTRVLLSKTCASLDLGISFFSQVSSLSLLHKSNIIKIHVLVLNSGPATSRMGSQSTSNGPQRLISAAFTALFLQHCSLAFFSLYEDRSLHDV